MDLTNVLALIKLPGINESQLTICRRMFVSASAEVSNFSSFVRSTFIRIIFL
jgi:hypothetical protein